MHDHVNKCDWLAKYVNYFVKIVYKHLTGTKNFGDHN